MINLPSFHPVPRRHGSCRLRQGSVCDQSYKVESCIGTRSRDLIRDTHMIRHNVIIYYSARIYIPHLRVYAKRSGDPGGV